MRQITLLLCAVLLSWWFLILPVTNAASPSLVPGLPTDDFDCPRAQPEPVLYKRNKLVKTSSFKRTSATEAIEKGVLTTGETVTVYHEGCESFVERFVFKLKDTSHPGNDLAYWFTKSADLLEQLHDKQNPLNLKSFAQALRKQAQKKKRLRLDDYIYLYKGIAPPGVAVGQVRKSSKSCETILEVVCFEQL